MLLGGWLDARGAAAEAWAPTAQDAVAIATKPAICHLAPFILMASPSPYLSRS